MCEQGFAFGGIGSEQDYAIGQFTRVAPGNFRSVFMCHFTVIGQLCLFDGFFQVTGGKFVLLVAAGDGDDYFCGQVDLCVEAGLARSGQQANLSLARG